MLKSVQLDIEYSSETSDLVDDFYIPCFINSIEYCRAVGYFTSQGLSLAVSGMDSFLCGKGKIRLIASPNLTEDDIEAINKGYEDRDKLIENKFKNTIDITADNNHLNLLSWLISEGVLDIKLAIRVDNQGKIACGIFHEKFGFFRDNEDSYVVFSGSANETHGGLVDNHESIDVYCSWDDPHGRVNRKVDKFEMLWSNEANKLKIIDFTKVAADVIQPYRTKVIPQNSKDKLVEKTDVKFDIPQHIKLRDYQKLAINNWFKNDGRGVFKLATGTGKTITALALAATLFNKASLNWIVVVCPYKHLVTQWKQECQAFGGEPIVAFGNKQSWLSKFGQALLSSEYKKRSPNIVITTTTTFTGKPFQQKLQFITERALFIADEVHNMGAKQISKNLPSFFEWRLGLSATPERWFDVKGTEAIFSYFGDVLKPELGLKEAIKMGVLTPYEYFPILVELTDDEYDTYYELTEKIGKIMGMGYDLDDEEGPLHMLLIQRARLLASAHNKLDELRKLATKFLEKNNMLFYCGDGRVDTQTDAEEQKQIDAVCKILGKEVGLIVSKYTAETGPDEREELKKRLSKSNIQGLVAIRCLDEGVDIPSIETAVILASSSNPRQFIQRRGRVLRRAEGKKRAYIYDMFVVPPDDCPITEVERNLIRKELSRFVEFSDLALNCGSARKVLFDVQQRFRLLDV